MKRIGLLLTVALIIAVGMTGCAQPAQGNVDFTALQQQLDSLSQDIATLKEDIDSLKQTAAAQPIAPESPAADVQDASMESPLPQDTAGQSTGNAAEAGITLEEAKNIALKHAEKTAEEVTFVQTKLDRDDGRLEYEIEFYHDNMEYDYEIDANTGDILSVDFDAEHYAPAAAPTGAAAGASGESGGGITLAQAKQIALDHAGLSADQVMFTKAKEDWDDGVAVYEIEFQQGRVEYEYDIRISDGKILEWDQDRD